MAADSFHRRLPARLRVTRRRQRLRWARRSLPAGRGAGGGLYHSPPRGGVTPPPALPMAGTRGLRGPGPAGPPPPRSSPAGARLLQPGRLIYLFPMCAPRRHGNRSIFSGVTRAPQLSNLPGTGIAKRLSLLLAVLGPLLQRRLLLPGVQSHPFTPSNLPLQLPLFSGTGILTPGILRASATFQPLLP